MSWENDLPPEYKPDFKTFGGNKAPEFKKHCFAKYCWAHRGQKTPDGRRTWDQLFREMYKETLDDYRTKTRALAAKRAAEVFNQQQASE